MATKPARGATSTGSRAATYVLLASLSVIWGLGFVAIRVADFGLSPTSLALVRWLIASVGFLAMLPFTKAKTRFEGRDLPRLLLIALANIAGYNISLNYAEKSISSGLAGILVSLGPVFMIVLSSLTLKERIGRRLVLALVLALAGTVLLSVSDLGVNGSLILGSGEAVLSALFYAVFTVASKPLVEKYGALRVVIWASVIGTVFLLPFASGGFVGQVSALSSEGWLALLYLSILSSVVGYSVYYTLVGRGPISGLSVQLYLIPIVSVIGGVLILQERVTVLIVVGAAVTLSAIALARTSKPETRRS
ncbi:MAG: DMT family transporter [Nitrososphaerales archaeon]|jgi:drug/metabolite transporter (DMT)-like permease